MKPVIHGKFYIPGQLEAHTLNVGYQSDSAVSGQERIRGQQVSGPEESWQRLQPVVECGDHAMTLTLRRRRAVQLQLDRVNESSVALNQLQPQCGYSIQTTWRDLSLMAQYDACHVTKEDDSYVLPLLWRGTPVKMSCPASQIPASPPSLCCSPYGMTIKVHGLSATEELRVNVREEWTALVDLAEQCDYTLDRQNAEIVITAPFITCGITVKDGKYTLFLQMGENAFTLACPLSPPEEPSPLTPQPLVNSPHHLNSGPTEHMSQSLEPFPWAPPFYLAPPYYPHPTYHHKYPSPEGHDAYNSPTPSSSTPDPTFGPQPHLPVDSQQGNQDYYSHQIPLMEFYKHIGDHSSPSSTGDQEHPSQAYPDLQQKQETPVLGLSERTHSPSSDSGFPSQVEVPPLQPQSHASSQYYHYYHHPKIPLPSPPRDPDPGPEVPSLTNPHQSEALSRFNSDQFIQPVHEAAPDPYAFPASAPHTPYPMPPYPYHYFYYFPHIAWDEAKRPAPLDHDMAAKRNSSDYQNVKSSTFVHPLPHDEYNLNPPIDQPKPDIIGNFQRGPEWIKHPLLDDDDDDDEDEDDDDDDDDDDEDDDDDDDTDVVKAGLDPPGPDVVAVPPPGQPSFPTPSPNHNVPHYPYYYYHPYYHYYQMYAGPESADNPVSPTSSKEALDPPLQASSTPPQHPSYRKSQTTVSPTESVHDIHHIPLHPYHYYDHLYYQPQVDNQEVRPASSVNTKSESQLPSDSDYGQMGRLLHVAEAAYPSMPQPSPFHSLYSHDPIHQHPYDPFGHPDGEEAEDNEMKDLLKANPDVPPASPCGLGPVSDVGCSLSSGCCSYPVKDCTVGQHLIFVVPDCVVEPSVALPAHPSEVSNVSCPLRRLTSDPDIYTVPLEGCGVNRLVFGQTVVHLLEVHGTHSLQRDHSSVHESSPVRLMVECSSSPGAPGEVRLHVMDRPAPPAVRSAPPAVRSTPPTATVQLRIATDGTFARFYPDAHLPLSLIRGRPVYVDVSLLDPPEPGLVLLVHSCLAYTQAPYSSWMLVYDGCPSRGDSQLLPSPRSDHIRRIMILSFLFLPSDSPTYMTNRGYAHLQDPEIFFSCLTEVCSATDGDCTVGCINSPYSDM